MASLEDDPELPKLLLEIGYMAAGTGLFAQADTIFHGLAAHRPDSELPWVGVAVARMNAGQPDEATRILREEALKRVPGSDVAKSFLGLSLKLAGYNAESVRVLEEVVATGQETSAVAMARSLLHTTPD